MCQREFSFTERKLTDTIYHCQSPRQARDVFFFLLRLNVSPHLLEIWFLKGTIYNQIVYDPQHGKNHASRLGKNFADILGPAS